MNENQVCCFTGHRNLPQWEENSMRQKLQAVIREFAIAGIRTYCAGGAMGFDTLAEQVVLELKKNFRKSGWFWCFRAGSRKNIGQPGIRPFTKTFCARPMRLFMFQRNIKGAACTKETGALWR